MTTVEPLLILKLRNWSDELKAHLLNLFLYVTVPANEIESSISISLIHTGFTSFSIQGKLGVVVLEIEKWCYWNKFIIKEQISQILASSTFQLLEDYAHAAISYAVDHVVPYFLLASRSFPDCHMKGV